MRNLLFSTLFLQVSLNPRADFTQLSRLLSCLKLFVVFSVPEKLLPFSLGLSILEL